MMRFIKHLGIALLLGILIYVVILFFLFLTGAFEGGFSYERALQELYENLILSVFLYFLNASWIHFLKGKSKSVLAPKRFFLIGIGGNVALSMIGVLLSRGIVVMGLEGRSLPQFVEGEQSEYYLVAFLIVIVVSLAFYGAWYFKYRQESQVKEQKMIAGTASAKFDALKNQLDPHFLFNSLNVLNSLIEEDPLQAQKFTTSLSKVYRYVLEQKDKDLVTVDEELNFAKTYIRLLEMRFEDSIIFDIPEHSSNPESKIVPLALQLLLENAVKHNIVASFKPLKIRVFEENGLLCIVNTLQEKQVVHKSSGVGLRNIQQRYTILSDREVVIQKTPREFMVKLPMLTQKWEVGKSMDPLVADERYRMAKKKVKAIKDFYGNLIAYLVVIPILALMNYYTSNFLWVVFPAMGWGLGVVLHGFEAFGRNPFMGKRWEDRRMREMMEDENF